MVSRLLLEYDGSAFAGWASQPGLRTVQGEVERALSVLLRRSDLALTVAGRTDAGVHAWGQVASYEGPVVPLSGLNALLPEDVAVLSCAEAPEGWSARFDASSRAYCYRVLARGSRSPFWRGRALWWPHAVDVSALQECARALVGVHDFTAFTPTETDHVRFERDVLASFWRRSDADHDLLEFWIEADAFMRHMNRVLVGTMLEVASGRRPLSSFRDESLTPFRDESLSPFRDESLSPFRALLAGQPRSAAGVTAPACGLYLAGVGYDGERVLAGE